MPTTAPSPFADQLAAFAAYLRRDKGLGPRTIKDRCQSVRCFLDRLAIDGDSLRHVTLSQIDQALTEQLTRDHYARVTVQDLACDLRSFFAFAEASGWCRLGLAAGIKGPPSSPRSRSRPAPRGTRSGDCWPPQMGISPPTSATEPF